MAIKILKVLVFGFWGLCAALSLFSPSFLVLVFFAAFALIPLFCYARYYWSTAAKIFVWVDYAVILWALLYNLSALLPPKEMLDELAYFFAGLMVLAYVPAISLANLIRRRDRRENPDSLASPSL